MIDIVSAMSDEKLFAPFVKDISTHRRWLTFYKLIENLPLDDEDIELAYYHTGRRFDRTNDFDFTEIAGICGRRAGKDDHLSKKVAKDACFNDWSKYLSPGERGVVLVVATDKSQASIFLNRLRAIFTSPDSLFRTMVEDIKSEEISLTNGITIMVKPCSYRAVRGYTLVNVVLSECAFYKVEGINVDREVVAACKPGMASIPGARLYYVSSPYARRGILYELFRDYWAKDDPHTLVWRGTTREMNPTISEAFIQREIERDGAAVSEYEATFRTDLETFLSVEAIALCTAQGREVLPPQDGIVYMAGVDPSGGAAGGDMMTCAIGHNDGDGKTIIDRILIKRPPFDPADAVKEFASVLEEYGCYSCYGDRYSAEWCRQSFLRASIDYRVTDKNKSALYHELEPVILSRQIELPDHKLLITQLRSLERRVGRSGDVIDHPARSGFHDDVSNCVAIVADALKVRFEPFSDIMWVNI